MGLSVMLWGAEFWFLPNTGALMVNEIFSEHILEKYISELSTSSYY